MIICSFPLDDAFVPITYESYHKLMIIILDLLNLMAMAGRYVGYN